MSDLETAEIERGDRIWWTREGRHIADVGYVMEVRERVIQVTPKSNFFFASAKRQSFWLAKSAIKVLEVEKDKALTHSNREE